MTRLLQAISRTALALAVLLFIATTVMWVRSHFASDRWYWPASAQGYVAAPPATFGEDGLPLNLHHPTDDEICGMGLARYGQYVVHSGAGEMEFLIDSPPIQSIRPVHSIHGLPPGRFDGEAIPWLASSTVTVKWSLLGFSYREVAGQTQQSTLDGILPRSSTKPVLVKRWAVPYWSLAALTGLLPLLWLFMKFRPRRRLAGQCPHCGYDLRATPRRCPECGTATAAAGAG